MKLFEYQSQRLLTDFNISVPGGLIALTPLEAFDIVTKMNAKAVVKAQVLTGGRGKAGGIKLVSTPDEAKKTAETILKMKIKNNPVKCVFITPAVEIKKEFYVSILINRSEKRIECIICNEGGIDIEEIARTTPERIHTIPLDPEILKNEKTILDRLSNIFDSKTAGKIFKTILKMYNLFIDNDCSLVEINPLVLNSKDELIALDAKIVIDDNALFRHPDLEELKNSEEYSLDEIDAKKSALAFVSLEGNIGCMVNGAGLAMATMDLIKYYGSEPANFLDIGGSSNPKKVVDGFKILLRNKNIKAILLNIFGGITRCDDIANGFIEVQKEIKINLPLIIRLIGTNDKEGIQILKNNGFTVFSDLAEAVKTAVQKAGKS